MPILVFKTNLRSKKKVNALAPHLESIQGIASWNVDLMDADRILRVDATAVSARKVEESLQELGYFCKELED